MTKAGTGNMQRIVAILLLFLLGNTLAAQEVLLPLCRQHTPQPKNDTLVELPFFDDFSSPAMSRSLWYLGGTFVNQGYAPLPPTIGMATLDAFDEEGDLYPTATGQLFTGDTLLSRPIRLDSLFHPYSRPISPSDSIYLSFFYLPGGGYGNMWERIGDTPEKQDSLILEFFNPTDSCWERVWSTRGYPADTLFAHTGSYWQFRDIPIRDPQYLKAGFQFRFYNLCSLDNNNKPGLLSNADQWNIDYISLNVGRHKADTASRDVAFVNPAPSLLRNYQAMPARQFTPSDMRDSLPLTITNRFTEELATTYIYTVYDNNGQTLTTYNGGLENTPVYWRNHSYQTAAAHAMPPLDLTLPVATDHQPTSYTVVHGLREGVSGDNHPQNDTIVFTQIFDNYYAYDDGTPENGYGLNSTSPDVRLACRFTLNTEDTLTALHLYFNRAYANGNNNIRFYITVWDDNNGHPGNIIYRDCDRRSPLFEGFNRYVRYLLEEPLICSGTIYVGLQQTSADYINLGFDRNNDASAHIFYLTGTEWQNTILRGSLMLRPAFGHSATLATIQPEQTNNRIHVQDNRIVVETHQSAPITIYNIKGQPIHLSRTPDGPSQTITQPLPSGLYLVRIGIDPAQKIIIEP